MSSIRLSSTIRGLRQRAGYTQAYVSSKLNIQRQTYSNYENASRTPPLEIIASLAELYNVSIDYLVRGAHSKMPGSLPQTAKSDPATEKMVEVFTSLPEHKRKEVLAFAQFKKNYAE